MTTDAELLGIEVHAAWRDGMLQQGREVAPNRLYWKTLSEQDRELHRRLGLRLQLRFAQFQIGSEKALRQENAQLMQKIETLQRVAAEIL